MGPMGDGLSHWFIEGYHFFFMSISEGVVCAKVDLKKLVPSFVNHRSFVKVV